MSAQKKTPGNTAKKSASPKAAPKIQKQTAQRKAASKHSVNRAAANMEPKPTQAQSNAVNSGQKLSSPLKRELIGVLVAICAVALFVAVVAPGQAILTQVISGVFRSLIGLGAFALPFLLLVWAASFFVEREIATSTTRLGIAMALIFVAVLAIIALNTPNLADDPDVVFVALNLTAYGGYVGAGVAFALFKLVGIIISYVILIGLILLGAVLIGFSITSLVNRIKTFFAARRERAKNIEPPQVQTAYDLDGSGLAKANAKAAYAGFDATAQLYEQIAPTAVLGNVNGGSGGAGINRGLLADAIDSPDHKRLIDDENLGQTRRMYDVNDDWYYDPIYETEDVEDFENQSEQYLASGSFAAGDLDIRAKTAAAKLQDCNAAQAGNNPDLNLTDQAYDSYLSDVQIRAGIDPLLLDGKANTATGGAANGVVTSGAVAGESAQNSAKKPRGDALGAHAANRSATGDVELSGAKTAGGGSPFTDDAPVPFLLPDLGMLKVSKARAATKAGESELRQVAAQLQATIEEFGVDAEVKGWVAGPTVTLFKLALGEGVRLSKINSLADDIALALAAPAVRIFSPIPSTTLVGIEVPNVDRSFVLLGDVLSDAEDGPLQLAIGKDVEGTSIVANLEKMPHLLIGGTTGSGKSVAINSMIMSVLMRATPLEVRMILIDPKMVELSLYNDIPHLYVPVVTDAQKAAAALAWGVLEMERRLKLFQKSGAKNIAQYNARIAELKEEQRKQKLKAYAAYDKQMMKQAAKAAKKAHALDADADMSVGVGADAGADVDVYVGAGEGIDVDTYIDTDERADVQTTAQVDEDAAQQVVVQTSVLDYSVIDAEFEPIDDALPLILIVIDELADLMMVAGKEVEISISRLAQLARAAGLHLIIATQRPSTNVITGLIKANIVNRIAFNVASGIDSRVILDSPGAEDLIGNGDLLFSRPEVGKPQRIQGCFVSEPEIERIVDFLKEQGEPEYHEDILATAVGGISTIQMGAGGGASCDDDPLVWEAADIIVSAQFGSTSTLQRRLKVGYARAGRIMDMLEQKGIVGPPNGSKPREVLIDDVLDLESLKAIEATDERADDW